MMQFCIHSNNISITPKPPSGFVNCITRLKLIEKFVLAWEDLNKWYYMKKLKNILY